MDRASIIDMMQSKITTPDEFNYDRLQGPPILSLLSMQDVQDLHYIATSVKYSGNARKKYKAIDDIMKARNFSKYGAGTNRVVYKYLDDDRFVFKIASDAIGMGDNPKEFKNQLILKPFCTKTFEVDPTGTVACSERVQPITNREEFELIASDVYELITNYIIGKYIMADIGTHYFLNYGLRSGFGVVILDYSFLYELDGNKLHCTQPDPMDSSKICGGIIDYDDGFNKLYCQKCGHWYRVQELAKTPEFKEIIEKRSETKMDVIVRRKGTVQHTSEENNVVVPGSVSKIQKPYKKTETSEKVQINPVRKNSPSNNHPQTHYQQKNPEPKRFEGKNNNGFNLKPTYKKETQNKTNIQRGVVRTANEPVITKTENGTTFSIPQPSKYKQPHFKRLSYNAKFKTITMYDGDGNRYVLELGEHNDIIQQIVDGSDYMANILSMKQSMYDTLKKNNSDLNAENETLTAANEKLTEEVQKLQKQIVDAKNEGLEQAQKRIQELETKVLELQEKTESLYGEDGKEPEQGAEEENFDYDKYSKVVFLNGNVSDLKTLGLTNKDSDNHKVLVFSDDVSDTEENMVLVLMINGILLDKYKQLKDVVDVPAIEDKKNGGEKIDTDSDGSVTND